MKIALIGANGQLGTDLRKIIPVDYLIEFNYPDFDITQLSAISQQLSASSFDLIISTAAYNLVDQAEDYPQEAMAVNYYGVENLVKICQKFNCPLVHFSTDYVFGADKTRNTPYTEEDIPGPINQYGKSKLMGEKIILQNLKKYFLIRTSYLFGTAGSQGKRGNIIESLIKKSEKNSKLRVVDDQVVTPTYTLDLARQVWKLIQTKSYGLYHITSEGQCSIYEFAKQLFKYLDKNVKIIPVKTQEYALPADRPHYSVLENKHLKNLRLNIMRPWQDGLKDYLKEKGHI